MRSSTLGAATAAVVVGTLGLAVAHASDQTVLPVNVCSTPVVSNMRFAQYGHIQFWGTGYGEVVCGLGQDRFSLDSNDDVRIYYKDGNGGVTTAYYNMYCAAYSANTDWSTMFYSGLKFGCSTVGGCTTNPGVYSGVGYINLPDVRHGGAFSVAVTCSLPETPVVTTPVIMSEMRTLMLDEQ